MSPIRENIARVAARVKQALRSTRGRNVLLYLLFVAVAFAFWLMLSLDNVVQRDFDVPVELVDVPDSVTVITPVPRSINVSVKGKGNQMLRFIAGSIPTFKIKWEESQLAGTDNAFGMQRARLETRLRDYFGQGMSIVSARPDSIVLHYTTRPGVKMRLRINADVEPRLQYIISGPLRASVDSVSVFSNSPLPRDLRYIETELLSLTDLRDTVRVSVRVKPVKGLRIIPDRVTVTVPVEPLISRRINVPVETINVPAGTDLITFPSKVDMTYLVPMSEYNSDTPIKAYVDYDKIVPGATKLPVQLSLVPELYRNVSLSPDSVEYVIDNNRP